MLTVSKCIVAGNPTPRIAINLNWKYTKGLTINFGITINGLIDVIIYIDEYGLMVRNLMQYDFKWLFWPRNDFGRKSLNIFWHFSN